MFLTVDFQLTGFRFLRRFKMKIEIEVNTCKNFPRDRKFIGWFSVGRGYVDCKVVQYEEESDDLLYSWFEGHGYDSQSLIAWAEVPKLESQ